MARGWLSAVPPDWQRYSNETVFKGKGKWPHSAQDKLQQLMIQHQLFIYHKLDTTSNDKLQLLLLDLHKCIDHQGWVGELHDEMLIIKVLGKLNRIRLQMLENRELFKSGDVYLLKENMPSSSQNSLDGFKIAVSELRRDEMNKAIDILHATAGSDKFLASLGRWLVQNQHFTPYPLFAFVHEQGRFV